MTALTERDPAPEQPWRECSSAGVRRLALQATAAAVKAAREKPADQQTEGTGEA